MRTPFDRVGVTAAILCYLIWGFLPIFWKFLKHFSATEILLQRIIWSFVFYFVLIRLTLRKSNREIFDQPRFDWLLATIAGILLSLNWGIYIYAVNSGRVLEGSLAYFINPLLNVVVGVMVFGEILPPALKWAVGLAAIGVLWKVTAAAMFPWIALVLAVTFCLYGIVKKKLTVEPRVSSVMESFALLLPAIALAVYLRLRSDYALTASDWFLFIASGVVTGLPLYLFSVAVQRLPYSFLGMTQFIAPSLQFLVGYYLFSEFVALEGWISFGFIWLGASVYLVYQLRKTFGATTVS